MVSRMALVGSAGPELPLLLHMCPVDCPALAPLMDTQAMLAWHGAAVQLAACDMGQQLLQVGLKECRLLQVGPKERGLLQVRRKEYRHRCTADEVLQDPACIAAGAAGVGV